MGLNDFILNCEKDNKELRKNIEYYKNKNQRLEKENQRYKEVINKLSESIDGHYDGFTTINEFGACNDIIELLLEFKDILKGVE